MKKILLIALASLLAFTFVSCSGDTPNTPDEKSNFAPVPEELWGTWTLETINNVGFIISKDDIKQFSHGEDSAFSLFGAGYKYGTTANREGISYGIVGVISGSSYYAFTFSTPNTEGEKTTMTVTTRTSQKDEKGTSLTYILKK